MTREEYDYHIMHSMDDDMELLMTQYITSLEERIAELEDSNKDMIHLYNELNTIKWWSAEKGDAWDGCVDAICDLIKKEYLPKERK